MNSLSASRLPHATFALGLCVLLAAASSCARHVAPSPSKPIVSALPPPSAGVPHPPARPRPARPFLAIAFPDLDTGQIGNLQFSPDGRRLAFGYGRDAEITLWNLESGQMAWQRHVEGASGGPVMMDPRGRFMIIQCHDPDDVVPIWVCTTKGTLRRKLPGYLYGAADVQLFGSGRFLATAGRRPADMKSIYESAVDLTEVYDTRTWRRIDRATGLSDGSVRLNKRGKIIRHPIIIKPRHAIQSQNGMPLATDEGNATHGDYLVSLSGNNNDKGTTEVWNQRRRIKLWSVASHSDCPRVAEISPDSRILAVGSIGGWVEFRELKTGTLIARTHCSEDVIRTMTFSPNGRVLAAAGDLAFQSDGIRLIDCATHRLLTVLKVAFPESSYNEKDWTLDHPDWFAALPDLSYIASQGVIQKMRTPGRPRDAATVQKFARPRRVQAALRKCYEK